MILVVDHDFNGSRLDRFLVAKTQLNHAFLCRMLRSKKILLNSLKVSPNQIVNLGDQVEILTKINLDFKESVKKAVSNNIVNEIRNRIVFENTDIAIIDKPYGLATQSGGSLKYSLDDIIRLIWPESGRIVHRLDKETSGLILVAKNKAISRIIFNKFSSGEVKKEYIAIVSGIPEKQSGIITTRISKDKSDLINRYKNSDLEGKESITEYRVISTNKDLNISAILFKPKTGRTHQIRLHSKFMNCPIIGDFRYGGDTNKCRKLNLLSYSIRMDGVIPDDQYILASIPDFFLIKDIKIGTA